MSRLKHRFCQDDRGAIAIMFGLILIVLGAFSGIAIDVSRAYATSSFMSTTTDQIGLAVARELSKGNLSEDELRDYAQARYNAAISGRSQTDVTYGSLDVVINADTGVVTANATAQVNTYFAGLVGLNQLAIAEQSVVSFRLTDLDVSLMLDITGSMNTDDRIGSLKTAARSMINLLIPETPNEFNRNRIALAPFSAGINVGSIATTVTRPGGQSSVDNCVVGRRGPGAHTDDTPGPGRWIEAVDPDTISAADDIDPIGDPDHYECPESEIIPLTNNRDLLFNNIDALEAGGTTAGHLGVEWAWYLVSPNWGSIWPSQSTPRPYDTDKFRKAVVLMTDGEFLLSYSEASSAERARRACQNMKAEGVVVYAVVFGNVSSAEDLFEECASGDEFFFTANNEQQLISAFERIGGQLGELRLVR